MSASSYNDKLPWLLPLPAIANSPSSCTFHYGVDSKDMTRKCVLILALNSLYQFPFPRLGSDGPTHHASMIRDDDQFEVFKSDFAMISIHTKTV